MFHSKSRSTSGGKKPYTQEYCDNGSLLVSSKPAMTDGDGDSTVAVVQPSVICPLCLQSHSLQEHQVGEKNGKRSQG